MGLWSGIGAVTTPQIACVAKVNGGGGFSRRW